MRESRIWEFKEPRINVVSLNSQILLHTVLPTESDNTAGSRHSGTPATRQQTRREQRTANALAAQCGWGCRAPAWPKAQRWATVAEVLQREPRGSVRQQWSDFKRGQQQHQEITRVILCRSIYSIMSFKPFHDIIMNVYKFLIGLCCLRRERERER